RLTLFGRSLLLVVSELLLNAICWIVAGILFGRNRNTQPVLSLALLAWTLGLRHALDADHISAIDNATRGLINLGQLPVTCGLFFSLGHSTIVVVATVAIAISSDVFQKFHAVGNIGGIVGAAVSGTFLFIVGLANTVILWRILKQRRKDKTRKLKIASGENIPEPHQDPKHNHMIMMRILGPVITFVNRPWKMYPVGVLFGFGFDTASSIALLAISAIAKKGPDGKSIPSAHIVILPLLFTAGMTMVDSMDSVLMLYSYSGFPEKSWIVLERIPRDRIISDENGVHEGQGKTLPELGTTIALEVHPKDLGGTADAPEVMPSQGINVDTKVSRDVQVKLNVMSGLSIILTLMSILVAFCISLITIMGLIGDNCAKCIAAAGARDGGGLAGSWWRGWGRANDNSGYIGAAIVGGFLIVVLGWYGYRWGVRKARERARA
ncbi:high-affinity nickel-transport protein-domain-containing protein, partial [Collybia nuda]